MNKNQKLTHLLAKLGDSVSIGRSIDVTDGRGKILIHIPVA